MSHYRIFTGLLGGDARKMKRPGLHLVEADLLSNDACGVDCLRMRLWLQSQLGTYDVPSRGT